MASKEPVHLGGGLSDKFPIVIGFNVRSPLGEFRGQCT